MSFSNKGEPEGQGWILKFLPFTSTVESSFWVRYCQEKLEKIKLSEEAMEIRASYGVVADDGAGGAPRLQFQESSLQPSSVTPNERVAVKGSLFGFNTLETFQKVDKNQLLHDHFCPKFFADGDDANVDHLNSVLLLLYADLKNHKILYWFGIPALLTRPGKSIRVLEQDLLWQAWPADEYMALAVQISSMRRTLAGQGHQGLAPFFVRSRNQCLALSKASYTKISAEVLADEDEVVFGFFDPAGSIAKAPPSEQAVGWPMRNLVAYLSFHLDLGGQKVKIVGYRVKKLHRISSTDSALNPSPPPSDTSRVDGELSVISTIQVPTRSDYEWDETSTDTSCGSVASKYKVVGWELNARAKPGPRWVNLRPLLDKQHLAIQAADLNLKLMKWRMIPNLNVDLLKSTKVLLIGAGTLGCSVARVLLGWGIRNFKIVDNGKVSYSNPARQSLFTLDDCHDKSSGGGRGKAVAAAEALQTIVADAESEGICLSIPMPGHSESRESIQESVISLDQLVQECDVVFLLTDTRESRWLPTVMAAAYNKILINAALGLDSWLVMRHGGGALCNAANSATQQTRFGCYFCNDIVAPENSTKNRTLDQQCTVTRPGLAPITSSMAAELLVSLLHHPDGLAAPAPSAATATFSPTVSAQEAEGGSPLGVIPHQIRGSLVSYTMMTPTVPAFKHCTGCSGPVVEAYLKDKIETVFLACQTTEGSYLEDVSGLTAFRAEAAEKLADMDDWEEDDDEEE